MSQKNKAEAFAALHKVGAPLILYNIWDPGSALAVSRSGAHAVATGSWPVAAAQGFADGQNIPLELLMGIAQRICGAVDLPVSIDMEAGYASTAAQIAANMAQVIDAGAVGVNFEDQIIGGEGVRDIESQSESIRAIRAMANQRDIPFFINARTDLFLKSSADTHASLMDEAKARAKAYADAGASGFFAPGLMDETLIKDLCDSSALPVNIIRLPGAPSSETLAKLGVARISYGPVAYRHLMKGFTQESQTHLSYDSEKFG